MFMRLDPVCFSSWQHLGCHPGHLGALCCFHMYLSLAIFGFSTRPLMLLLWFPEVVARLASSPQCDVGEVLLNKLSREPEAVALPYLRQSWQVS
jgi:hypothetical protein